MGRWPPAHRPDQTGHRRSPASPVGGREGRGGEERGGEGRGGEGRVGEGRGG